MIQSEDFSLVGTSMERRKSGPWQPLVSSNSENIPGDQTTTTSIGKADELDTGNSSPCNDGKSYYTVFIVGVRYDLYLSMTYHQTPYY